MKNNEHFLKNEDKNLNNLEKKYKIEKIEKIDCRLPNFMIF